MLIAGNGSQSSCCRCCSSIAAVAALLQLCCSSPNLDLSVAALLQLHKCMLCCSCLSPPYLTSCSTNTWGKKEEWTAIKLPYCILQSTGNASRCTGQSWVGDPNSFDGIVFLSQSQPILEDDTSISDRLKHVVTAFLYRFPFFSFHILWQLRGSWKRRLLSRLMTWIKAFTYNELAFIAPRLAMENHKVSE